MMMLYGRQARHMTAWLSVVHMMELYRGDENWMIDSGHGMV